MIGGFLTPSSAAQILIYFAVVLLLVKPVGTYMAKVYMGQRVLLTSVLGPVERFLYRLAGIDPAREMDWKEYAMATLLFSLAGFLFLYAILLTQSVLPLNPMGVGNLPSHLAFNAAVSFSTNTNWQSYSGEAALSYFSQMVGLTTQNFVSAATGMAVLVALIRGLSRRKANTIGNFWSDMLRGNLYILLPLAVIWALLISSQGVVQTLSEYKKAAWLEPSSVAEQTLAVGPAATQIAIKQVGTNGGGFFNTNSAHPFENPTPLSSFIEMLAILLLPASLCYTFGVMVGDRRQGWAVMAAMAVVFLPLLFFGIAQEQNGNPRFTALGIDQTASELQAGGNMEGKEVRFGIANSAMWAAATTATSSGSVNSMLDSYTPLGGFVPMILIQFDEVIFGGVGSGLYSMLVFAIIAVFIAGLMVGRTPEYLGKKIQAFEIKMASLAILVMPAIVLIGTAIAVVLPAGQAGAFNPGAHGFSEILYAVTSAGNNNGSAFAGINAATPFYDVLLGFSMLLGRFWIMIPVLAVAGSLAAKNTVPESVGTMPTHTPLFVVVLVSTVIMGGVLSFVPALALGPVVEHLMLHR